MNDESIIIHIAKACHQANKIWCEANGDHSQADWDLAEQWQRESAINGVKFRIENPNAGNDAQHNNWMKEKIDNGWEWGEVKDTDAKTHPCIVTFDKLPEFQQKKDALFGSIVDALVKEPFHFNFEDQRIIDQDEFHQKDVKADKLLRVGLDAQLQNLKGCHGSRERSLAITKVQEAIMWLGMDLKRLNEPNPYPNSYNPANSIIEPTADGLKM